MKSPTIASGTLAILGLALAACDPAFQQDPDPAASTPPVTAPSAAPTQSGLLYGRITTDDGASYEGRLRWGVDEEALWSNYFNGYKDKNPWVASVPAEQLPKERHAFEVFGVEIIDWERQVDLGRPFMVRFGDIVRIEPRGRDIRVTLKSGTVFELDRFEADDLADGVRVWDQSGVVDIGEWQIRTIELLPTPQLEAAPQPLYGTVRTRQGAFTGLIQWDREACIGSDELHGNTADDELSLRFETIRSIARRSHESSVVTLLDGRNIVLSGTRQVGDGNRGIYVDDARYGRVLVSWDAFERVDFSPHGFSPAFGDFPPGHPLRGSVITRSGRRLSGRLVYDLDESETTETLDAPSQGVDYTIPFGLVASIAIPGLEEPGAQHVRVTLHSGEELQLERTGDLDDRNAGLLIFSDDGRSPEYVPWSDLGRVDFDRAPATNGPRGAM